MKVVMNTSVEAAKAQPSLRAVAEAPLKSH